MIIDFRFENYKSFKSARSFSMARDTSVQTTKDSIYAQKSGKELSRVSAIYGSNASGKTNLLDAFYALAHTATRAPSDDKTGPLAESFAGNEDSPTKFSISFVRDVEGDKYSYEMDTLGDKIVYERLHVYHSNQPTLVFEREDRGEQPAEISFGSMISQEEQDGVRYVAQKDRSTSLVYFLRRSDRKEVSAVYRFLSLNIRMRNADITSRGVESLKMRLMTEPGMSEVLNSILPSTGLGIDKMEVAEKETASLNAQERKIMENAIKEVIRLRDPRLRDKELTVNSDIERILLFTHVLDGKVRELKLEQESDGTKAALVLLGDILPVLVDGTTYIIDELDRSLHPSLVSQLVKVFNSESTNPRGAQLIFTTHDVTLLDASIYGEDMLDRDQVWFVDKNSDGLSDVYPLTSVKNTTRKETNMYKKYIEGRYGAIPDVSLPLAVATFWEERK